MIGLVILFSLWLGLTIAVDFVAVPLVFRTISHLNEAGSLGIAVFSRLNDFEILIGVAALVLAIIFARKSGVRGKILLAMSVVLTGLAFTYSFWLSPTISQLTEKMHIEVLESAAYLAIQQEHRFYHDLYIKLDTVKILILALGLFISSSASKREKA
jgi:hypothetical protein